jgi:hypothetical protein
MTPTTIIHNHLDKAWTVINEQCIECRQSENEPGVELFRLHNKTLICDTCLLNWENTTGFGNNKDM